MSFTPISAKLLVACLLTMTIAAKGEAKESLFLGKMYGSGRACSGKFSVTRKILTWNTPFNHCIAVPYQILAQEKDAEHLRIVYKTGEAASSKNKCPFPIITLTHESFDSNAKDRGWVASGYLSEEAWKKDDPGDSLVCSLW